MNCAKHTDAPAVAYCRLCGKAICAECKRDVQGAIYCEECLLATARQAAAQPMAPPPPPTGASPGLATLLGFIPGVGAMYNGQFAKGFVHVIAFATLIWLADHASGLFGLGVAAWMFYMVFDAYTTAKARKYGQPLPDPLGINRMLGQHEPAFVNQASRVGEQVGARMEQVGEEVREKWQQWNAQHAGAPNPGAPPDPPPEPQAGTQAGFVPQQGAYYAGPGGTYYSAPQAAAYAYVPPQPVRKDRGPVGALILIALGCVFLLSTLGLMNFNWGRFWPVVLIIAGVAIFLRRFGYRKPPAPPASEPPAPPEQKAE